MPLARVALDIKSRCLLFLLKPKTNLNPLPLHKPASQLFHIHSNVSGFSTYSTNYQLLSYSMPLQAGPR